jgi:hypothetical protein
MKRFLFNVIAFYVGWFCSVLGAAHGYPLAGPLAVVLILAVHLKLNPPWQGELALCGISLAAGFCVDSVLVWTGVLSLRQDFLPAGLTSVWMMMMWVNFVMTLNVSLKKVHGHPWIAAWLGALGGPAAYYTGERLGAITIPDPRGVHLLIIGAAWAVATPLLFRWARRLERHFTEGCPDTARPLNSVAKEMKP